MLVATNILIKWSLATLLATGPCRDTVSQGIEGTVYRASGNHMPAPGMRSGAPAGVRTVVYIFALTSISQVTPATGPGAAAGSSSYYTRIHTRLIKQAETDSNGYFRVSLPPGSYSLFTKKGELFFASRRDDKNNIAPVEVLPGKITRTECRVESDHRPVY